LVEYDETKISEKDIIKIIEKSGYKATNIEFKAENEAKIWFFKSIF
jgi:hypothetical protein